MNEKFPVINFKSLKWIKYNMGKMVNFHHKWNKWKIRFFFLSLNLEHKIFGVVFCGFSNLFFSV